MNCESPISAVGQHKLTALSHRLINNGAGNFSAAAMHAVPAQVRISGGRRRGVLEMRFLVHGRGGWDTDGRWEGWGRWGAVCQHHFGEEEADAVCMTLGFDGGWKFGTTHGDDDFALDDLNCPAGSADLSACMSRAPYNDDCNDEHTVGIQCSGDQSDLGLCADCSAEVGTSIDVGDAVRYGAKSLGGAVGDFDGDSE